jgi:hypothetical protein
MFPVCMRTFRLAPHLPPRLRQCTCSHVKCDTSLSDLTHTLPKYFTALNQLHRTIQNVSSQNYCFFLGLSPLSSILENRKTTFRQLDLFPSSGEEGRRRLFIWVPMRKLISVIGVTIVMYGSHTVQSQDIKHGVI